MKHSIFVYEICVAIWLVGCIPAQASNTYTLSKEALIAQADKVLYKKTKQADLFLYILKPAATDTDRRLPAVVSFTGGGWVNGLPSDMIGNAAWFRDQGYVGIVADYRVKSRHGTTPMESIQDAKSAIRYVRSHAPELGIASNQIIVEGGSAGGHLAASTVMIMGHDEPGEDTMISSKADALILHNPVLGGLGAGSDFLTDHPDCAPINLIRAGLPPTIISCGTNDSTTPYATALAFVEKMKKEGNTCELITVEGAVHSCDWPVDNPHFVATLTRMVNFLKENGFPPLAK